jgi:hypothetical protein
MRCRESRIVSRRNRLLIWLAGILTLLGLSYASLPWLLVTVVKHSLAARGLSDIRLRVDYPHWRGMRLHSLAFTSVGGGYQIRFQLADVEISYHLTELVTGSVARIRVPVAEVHIQSATGSAPSGQSSAALPLAALASGRWLTQLPIRELSLDRLSVDWQAAADTLYALQLSAHLQDAQLQVNGDIHLPPQQKPIAFAFKARYTGAASLVFSPSEHAAKPLLQVTVTSVVGDQEPVEVNGVLQARLDSLVPVLAPWLHGMNQVSSVEGELDTQWQARISDSTWQVTGEAAVHGLSGHWHALAMPASELMSRFALDSQRATLHTTLSTAAHAVVVQADVVHQFAGNNGHADLKLMPVVFTDSGFILSRLLKSWPYPFDVTAGSVSASVQVEWNKVLKSKLDLQLNKLGGHYNKMTFSGLSGDVGVAVREGIATSKDAQLRVDLLDVGFPVEKIDAQFALVPRPKTLLPVVQVKKFSAALLGGRAHSGPFTLDFGRDKNAFVVQLEHIGLNNIMQLEQQEGLEGSGMLDGQIPITVSHEGIAVANGQLSARAPGGVIRYLPTQKVATLAQTNPSVKMIVEALSNYQYQVMDVKSDYKSGGDLTLQVHLEGKNPDWQAGQPVHLNLNLQENIPKLLRSLQLSDEITERLQKHYQNPP